MIRQTAAISILVGLFAGCMFDDDPIDSPPSPEPPRDLKAAERALVEADNTFGFALFNKVNELDPGKNIFISPLSVSMALGMTLNGAAGSTLDSMRQTLACSGITQQDINDSYRSLIELIMGLDPTVTSFIANSIWYRVGLPVKAEFINVNKAYFNAEVAALDFSDPGAPAVINTWVNRNTNGRIPKIIDDIPPEIVMYLIDAIYFKGTWTTEFDPADTHDDSFRLLDGSPKAVRMMRLEDTLQYWENDNFQAVDLPYGDGFFSMTIVLPKPEKNIDQLVAEFTQENWGQWVSGFRDKKGTLELPRFKLEYELQMNSVLQALGMGVAFETCCADFSGIADVSPERLYISEVKHKTFVEVNEEGTEAAAVTSVAIGKTSVGDSFTMKVNRPFLFVIREHHSNAIIFAGKILAP